MSEHLSVQNIERYLRRTLTPEELLRADDHLAACADCRARAAEGTQVRQIFASLYSGLQEALRGADDHLAYEQIVALVDGELGADESESVASHLASCPACVAETDDLRAFTAALTADQGQRAEAAQVLTKVRARWLRLFAWPPRQLALTAATILVLFTLSAALFLLLRPHTRPGEVSRSQPSPAPSPAALRSESIRPEDSATNEQSGQTPPATSQPTAMTENAGVDGSSMVVLNDGGVRVGVNHQGRVEGLEWLPPSAQREVGLALTGGRLETPAALAQLRGKPGALMGGANQGAPFTLLDPVGAAVRSDRPTLRWQPLDGATQYTVTVFDPNFNTAVKSPPLKQTVWDVPAVLKRGQVYAWQVTAIKDGREVIAPAAPAPEARFEVLGREREDELARVEHARTHSHLARGVVYARAGLLEDAEREFRALVRDNPRSKLAHRFLSDVRALRRAR